jgi:hypothetical protein
VEVVYSRHLVEEEDSRQLPDLDQHTMGWEERVATCWVDAMGVVVAVAAAVVGSKGWEDSTAACEHTAGEDVAGEDVAGEEEVVAAKVVGVLVGVVVAAAVEEEEEVAAAAAAAVVAKH